MTQLQKVISGTTYTTNYQYNVAGELTQIQYPSGGVVQQSVDAIGRLCEIAPSTTGCGTASSPYATGYGYNVASQVTGFKYGNGIFASLGFSSDRLQLNCLDYSPTNRGGNCTHDPSSKFSLTYSYGAPGSNNGQISGITDNSGTQEAGRSVTYTYDPLYRLSIATTTGSTGYPAWGLQETYDRYGNRSAQAVNSGCTGITCPTNSFTPDPATNRITGDCYDANGNLLAESAPPCPSPTYTYDAENRMVNYLGAAYAYDGNGLRVNKVSGSTTTVYVFSGSKVIAEYDNGAAVGSPSREYIYSGSALLAKVDSSGTKYYHQDHLSNRLVTDSSGNTVAQLGHFPFGESWYNATGDKLLFTSYERDSESGNDYAMARYNMSRLARFSSPDPLSGDISDPQSHNHYLYVGNDPISFVDPTGLNRVANLCGAAYDCSKQSGGEGDWGGDWWYADLLNFAFTPTGWENQQVNPSNCPDGDCSPWQQVPIYGNIGVLDFLGAPDPGSPSGNTSGGTPTSMKDCYGTAHIVGPGAAGEGKFGATTIGSLAVIPSQFFGSNSTTHAAYTTYGGMLRPYAGQISVTVFNPGPGPVQNPVSLTFGPVTDAIDRTGAANLVAKFPDALILETNGFYPRNGAMNAYVVVHVPAGLDCPQGTREKK